MGRQLDDEREGRRRAELKAEQLKVDLGGMEVLVNNGITGNDDSMVQLGLSGAAEVAGTNSSSLRIREELHRSLVGNRTKREEISKLETACSHLEKQLREKEFEALTASETEKGLRVQIENLQLEGGGDSDNVDKLKVMEE